MKAFYIFFAFSICTTIHSIGQGLSSKVVRGTYSRTTGEAGRTIQKNDNTYNSIPPVTHSKTILKLKSSGKALETRTAYHGMGIDTKIKGRWKLKDDTLTISYKHQKEKYQVDQSTVGKTYLKSLYSESVIYRKEE